MSMTLTFSELAVILPSFVLFEALFSGSEIALLSADKLSLKKLGKLGKKGALRALELSNHPERILSTTLLMTSLCVIGFSSLVSLYFLQNNIGRPEMYTILVTSPVIVIFGELLPKTISRRNANRMAPWVAYPVSWAYWALFPITRLLSSYTTRLSRIVGPIEELLAGKKKTTREELRSLLTFNRRETEIKTSEKRMIKRIFDFKDTEAKHALIPLVRVDAIEDTSTIKEALETFDRHRHSRMPVYSERVDNIIGILEISDLISANDLGQPIRLYISAARYAAETQSLEDLMLDMRREDNEMVVVVDEHGGAVGILTFEDIVEEIVGEISDEYDRETANYKELSPASWLVQARMEISQINELLHVEIPTGEYETLSGFLLQQFGRIPESRDELFFTTPAGSFKFLIRSATERHIETVLIEKIEST